MCILCILLPVLVGLICAIPGYLLSRLSLKNSEELTRLRADLETCKKEREKQLSLNSSFKSDLDSWRNKYNSLQSDYDAYKLKFTAELRLEFLLMLFLLQVFSGKKYSRTILR